MTLNKIIEIVRIKQEIREVEEAYTSLLPKQIRSSPDAIAFIQALIAEEDREVFFVRWAVLLSNHFFALICTLTTSLCTFLTMLMFRVSIFFSAGSTYSGT